jgi:hypothetical protein
LNRPENTPGNYMGIHGEPPVKKFFCYPILFFGVITKVFQKVRGKK